MTGNEFSHPWKRELRSRQSGKVAKTELEGEVVLSDVDDGFGAVDLEVQ